MIITTQEILSLEDDLLTINLPDLHIFTPNSTEMKFYQFLVLNPLDAITFFYN